MKVFTDRLKQLSKEFLRDEAGQSTTEYILILAVVVMVAMKFKTKFQGTMNNSMNNLDRTLNDAFDPNK